MRAQAGELELERLRRLDVDGGRVVRLHSMLNPDKLGHLGPLSDLGLRPSRVRR